MNPRRRGLILTAALSALPAMSWASEAVPSDVRLIIPWPAGSGGDIAGRLIAAMLSRRLHTNIYVENRAGASGTIGSSLGSREAPDGATLILGNSASHGSAPFYIPRLSYDPITSFAPISMLYRNSLVLAVNEKFPATSLAELVAYARANPGKLSYGTPGVGTPHQLVCELLQREAGIRMTHVPYKGSAKVLTDLAGGHIQIAVSAQAAALELYRSKIIRILAVADKTRTKQLPDVPAIAETYPGFDVAGWGALFAPKNLPNKLVERYNAAVVAALSDPDLRNKLEAAGFLPVSSTPAELLAIVKQEHQRWASIVKHDMTVTNTY
ncbi:Bug family tripartite tricarboxylate transporter substrate binding protein [Candidimonas nitroreducens]|uniref:ABC transporter substrate-binding protein n=1 Tax=Candidimonas nitroreducens TaxID=683354 RepID=A0A225ML11_9BURK|nr:tripartite tricarboxylate transporter substrate binding protein [Candidimonas nitroreducens]OWT60211.1 hypothetical protein CEY11_11150 [Candidimonas nitroreducens]